MQYQPDVNIKGVFSRVGFALTFSMISVNLVQLVVAGIMGIIDPNLLMTDWANFFLIAISFYGVGFPIAYCLVRKIPTATSKQKSTFTGGQVIKYSLISYTVMIILNVFTTALLSLIELLKSQSIMNPVEQVILAGSPWLSLLCVVILSPIIEEVLFRKVILDRIRVYGDKIAIVFTGIAFGLYHGNLSQFFYATALGMILAYMVLQTNRLRYSIGVHMFINAMGSLIIPFLIGDGSDLIRTQIASLIVGIMITLGIILLIKDYKKVTFSSASILISKENYVPTIWLNPGVFAYLLFSISMIIMVLLIT